MCYQGSCIPLKEAQENLSYREINALEELISEYGDSRTPIRIHKYRVVEPADYDLPKQAVDENNQLEIDYDLLEKYETQKAMGEFNRHIQDEVDQLEELYNLVKFYNDLNDDTEGIITNLNII